MSIIGGMRVIRVAACVAILGAACSTAGSEPKAPAGDPRDARSGLLEALSQRIASDEVGADHRDPNFSFVYADHDRDKVIVGLAHVGWIEQVGFFLRYGGDVELEEGVVNPLGSESTGTILRA